MLEIDSDKGVNESRDGLDSLKARLVLDLAFLQASYVLLRNCVDQSQWYHLSGQVSQLGRPSDSTVRGDISVIRQNNNHSLHAHCKLNLMLVVAKVNILTYHFDYVKIWDAEMLPVEIISKTERQPTSLVRENCWQFQEIPSDSAWRVT